MKPLKKISRGEVLIILEQLRKFEWLAQDEAFNLDAAKQFEELRWKALRKTADQARLKKLQKERKRVASSTFLWPGQQDELNRLDADIRRVTFKRRSPHIR